MIISYLSSELKGPGLFPFYNSGEGVSIILRIISPGGSGSGCPFTVENLTFFSSL